MSRGSDIDAAKVNFAMSSGFWDDIEDIVKDIIGRRSKTGLFDEKTEELRIKEGLSAVHKQALASLEATAACGDKADADAGGELSATHEDGGRIPDAADNEDALDNKRHDGSRKSAGLADEIEMIRLRYIVGKLAGEDLFDSKGALIVAKNSTITAQVVKRAEEEGKLSELIVNMMLPGLE